MDTAGELVSTAGRGDRGDGVVADSERQEEPRPPLADEHAALTRDRIRRGAMAALALYGFDATVEEIAELSGVSARTVFRYFETHAHLVLCTVEDMFRACGERPIAGLPRPEDDLEGWLRGLASTIHRRNASILGHAFWDIHNPRAGTSGPLGEVDRLRRQYRTQGVRHLVRLAWATAGGEGEPPEDLHMAFALNFSAFATHALMNDFEQTPEQIGKLTAEILIALLRRAVAIGGE
jgi:AcrR family transcriptional regulator